MDIKIDKIYKQKNINGKLPFQLRLRYKVIDITANEISITTINEDFNSSFKMSKNQFEKHLIEDN